jgi:hypothetical protein
VATTFEDNGLACKITESDSHVVRLTVDEQRPYFV